MGKIFKDIIRGNQSFRIDDQVLHTSLFIYLTGFIPLMTR